MDFKTLDDGEFRDKHVLVRIDLNAPVIEGEVRDCLRFERYAKTIQELLDRKAKVVIMAHQGRPTRKDFKTLQRHSKILSRYLNTDVRYIDEVFSYHVRTIIRKLEPGEALLLENVRFLSEELKNLSPQEHSQSIFVRTLAPEFEVYVNDAFSAAHRAHTSLVGFFPVLDSYAGRVMESEIKSLRKFSENLGSNEVLLLGGAKPKEVISVIKYFAPKEGVNKLLLGGAIGEIALIGKGYDLGDKKKWLEERGLLEYVDEFKKLMEKYENKFELPSDLAFEVEGGRKEFPIEELPKDHLCYGIGSKTIGKYKEVLKDAGQILMKGPMGVYEREEFKKGSKELIEAIAQSNAFTVLGGGHTSSIIRRLNVGIDDFSHVSVAGGAFIQFLSDQELAVIEALKKYG